MNSLRQELSLKQLSLFGQKTLPEICMMLHMHTSGASPIDQDLYEKGIDLISKIEHCWEESWSPKNNNFDSAVKNLVHATIYE